MTDSTANRPICQVQQPGYEHRYALKLLGAIDPFGVDPTGWICADFGSSTGGRITLN